MRGGERGEDILYPVECYWAYVALWNIELYMLRVMRDREDKRDMLVDEGRRESEIEGHTS